MEEAITFSRAVAGLVEQALERLRQEGTIPPDLPSSFQVEHPRDKSHGDYAVNAAMTMARAVGQKPRDLAARIVAALPAEQMVVERMEVAGPGFINFFLSPSYLRATLRRIRREGAAYGRCRLGEGKRILLEFVSANPTGPMHVGHGRGAVTGDVLGRLLAAVGFQVEREYYINDAGAQVQVLGRSVLLRYRELHGMAVIMPDGCYPAEYVVEIARALQERDGDRWLNWAENEPPPGEVVEFAIAHVLIWIREDLERLAIRFDHWFSERSLHEEGGIDHAIGRLEEKELLYQGVLAPPKGKLLDDWEPRPQLLFRASAFGDEVDRTLRKSDGGFTYFAADIAYHLNKAERGYERLIDIWGADHGGYVARVQAALLALTGKKNLLEVKLVQMVNLTRGGVPVRMSKRAGTFVTLREVVEEVGADAVRFWFLTRADSSQLDFDLDLAVARSNDNPVFYVQYAHARICSVWRQLEEKGFTFTDEEADQADLDRLVEKEEGELMRRLGQFPEVVEGAALHNEPHRLPYYLLELAAAFHGYYNSHRLLEEDGALRNARLVLMSAIQRVLANGLDLLGVSFPERM